MNTATIRRGTGRGGRLAAQPRNGRKPVRKASVIDKWLAALPVGQATLARLLTLLVSALALALAWIAASFLGLPAMARMEMAQLAARAGFEVTRLDVEGVDRLDSGQVYALALDQMDRSMLNVDLAAVRARMLTLGWVKEARVTRRLPDTLVIDIVERKPVAVWQHDGALSLIDAQGVVLEPLDGRTMPDLPLVVGPDANRRTGALKSLLDAAPALKPVVTGATWIGNRRWNLKFQSGELLLLPEGEAQAAAALMKFAEMEGVNHLLGRGIVRFDMRDPSRFVLRLPPDRGAKAAPAPSGTTQGASAREEG